MTLGGNRLSPKMGDKEDLQSKNCVELETVRDDSKVFVPITLKWFGQVFEIEDVSNLSTVRELKELFMDKTGVKVERQKLLNLKHEGKVAGDEVYLSDIPLKPGQRIMMMGSLEKEYENVDVPPEDRPNVNNDLDVSDDGDDCVENKEVYLNKIEKRIKDYHITELNPLREGKKLLVLDIDYTLFDHRSVAETGVELMRPYLHEFLTSAYENYDIVIWSATSMKWIEEKMKLLGVSSSPSYKVAFYLDYLAMISVHTQKYGVIEVKPLGVIWGKYNKYCNKNTIMVDDLRRNFLMNPQCGLKIRPFRSAHLNRDKDRELHKLSKYLKNIAQLDDLSSINHRKWESYRPKGSRRSNKHDVSSSSSSSKHSRSE